LPEAVSIKPADQGCLSRRHRRCIAPGGSNRVEATRRDPLQAKSTPAVVATSAIFRRYPAPYWPLHQCQPSRSAASSQHNSRKTTPDHHEESRCLRRGEGAPLLARRTTGKSQRLTKP
jgi:hypothetical protein